MQKLQIMTELDYRPLQTKHTKFWIFLIWTCHLMYTNTKSDAFWEKICPQKAHSEKNEVEIKRWWAGQDVSKLEK